MALPPTSLPTGMGGPVSSGLGSPLSPELCCRGVMFSAYWWVFPVDLKVCIVDSCLSGPGWTSDLWFRLLVSVFPGWAPWGSWTYLMTLPFLMVTTWPGSVGSRLWLSVVKRSGNRLSFLLWREWPESNPPVLRASRSWSNFRPY